MRELQRSRILSAVVELTTEGGARRATVARVVERAGVSRGTFYELFENRNDCLAATFDAIVAMIADRARAACPTKSRWLDQLRSGLLAALEFFDEEPRLAHLCIVEAMAFGPATLNRRAAVLDELAEILDQGGSGARGRPAPPLTAESAIGGAIAVVYARLLRRDQRPLVDLLNPLTALIVLPYLGRTAASRERKRQAPTGAARPPEHSRPSDPLDGLKIRLTYRTLRVVTVVGAEPDLSNIEVSERADIADQGQVSKLLARLARLGLLENRGDGPSRGATNAWRLTPKGRELERGILGTIR
jgi:AcrR family transcriptional regulator/DNA-binding MarR family transcriptional regulator